MNIKCFKLVSGEEIISECKVTDDEIILNNPARMAMVKDEDKQGMVIIPWIPITNEKEIFVKKTHVMYIVEPVPELAQEYNKRFGSGLVVPPQGSGIIV